MTLQEFLEFELFHIGEESVHVSELLWAMVVLIIARLFMRVLVEFALARIFKYTQTDIGRRYAIETFIKYIIWLLAFVIALRIIGYTLQGLWVGSAALLVGVGIGLQQTFNDLISGIIILTGNSVRVGDVVKVDNSIIGRLQKIGLRTSTLQTRDNNSMIIPNSHLVVETFANWSHNSPITRFDVDVGVAYGSNVKLVEKLMLQAAEEHQRVLDTPKPRVMFRNFGDSSLDFTLYFFSKYYFEIEWAKSDLRFRIDELFRENGVEIPFPQRDMWVRNAEQLRPPATEVHRTAETTSAKNGS